MNKQDEFRKLTNYIEENLRSFHNAGISFIDTRDFRRRLNLKQNHVVYGRRGSGKTSLVTSSTGTDNHLDIYIDVEEYKDITFPNIVIRILLNMFSIIDEKILSAYPFYKLSLQARTLHKQISIIKKQLQPYLYEPDTESQDINTKQESGQQLSTGINADYISAGLKSNNAQSREVKRTVVKDKINYLRIELPVYKNLLLKTSKLFNSQPIFLTLDDYYFVDKDSQPDLIDYFHRLSKDTSFYLKIATIKHRSKLYRRLTNSYVGVEQPHDIQEIDMDYTLSNFEELQNFMQKLLNTAIVSSRANITFNDIFTGEGFSQLCLASGGVPRDFLDLFVILSNKYLINDKYIGKIEVTESAISNISRKLDSMKTDSGNENSILEDYLFRIKYYVFNKNRTNAFLICKDEFKRSSQIRQAIRELVDLRLVHLIDDNTSKAPSDGLQYEAYILDIGLYDNSRPRSFKQIEPGKHDDKSRKDDLRSSPILSSGILNSIILNSSFKEMSLPLPDNKSIEKPIQGMLSLSFTD